MNTQHILFFDSGVGGLPYLASAQAALPGEHFIYAADRLHYPYGQKSVDEIRKNVLDSMAMILNRFPVKAAVIACNTASVVALDALRAQFSIPFVGVVPAVKPAAQLTRNNRIGVLATPQTIKNDYLTALINDFANSCEVFRIPAPDLRDLVELHFFTATQTEKTRIVRLAVKEIKHADVDVVVLACTHFLFTFNELQQELGEGIHIIDSREGVTNQLKRILSQHRLLRPAAERRLQDPAAPLYLTGDGVVEIRYRHFAEMFHLSPVKVLA
ncbi:MAG: glutamate racemase [Spirochaetales bacterium]|nr:glutamate racemase [Spirochaetales bacterium]